MISIIVSSYKADLFDQFSKNVAETIGVPYEIIKIDNPGLMGICEAYNKGAENAKFEYLCFCHEDILFQTINWGQILIRLFDKDSSVGLIGVAGSSYKAWIPSGWFTFPQASRFIKMHIGQRDETGKEIHDTRKLGYINYVEGVPEQVSSIDGCFMATKKAIGLRFDEELFKGYHCYDVDYSLQVGQKYKVVVTFDILIEHLSHGSFKKDWFLETNKLHAKWYNKLPLSTEPSTKRSEIKTQEVGAFVYMLEKSLKFDINPHYLLRYTMTLKYLRLCGLRSFLASNFKVLRIISGFGKDTK